MDRDKLRGWMQKYSRLKIEVPKQYAEYTDTYPPTHWINKYDSWQTLHKVKCVSISLEWMHRILNFGKNKQKFVLLNGVHMPITREDTFLQTIS